MNKTALTLLFTLIASVASADDFPLDTLEQAKNPTFDLAKMKGQTYYDVVHNKIAGAMEAAGDGGANNETKLRNGDGVSVKLGKRNYNVHINFPASEMGGRSYGWTNGKVGDWSDSMYLRNLAEVMKAGNAKDIKNFYKVIIKLLGSSDPKGLEKLEEQTQRVATNFLAIYTAEEYRRIQNSSTVWDDALTQVTLLGAFHGGQETFEMFYVGKFTGFTKKKGPGVYANGSPGKIAGEAEEKKADMEDYHQFSWKTTDMEGSNRSGINLTRDDFELMGQAITEFEKNNANLKEIQSIIKRKSDNVYADLAAYFAEGKANAKNSKALAEAVANFMVDTFNHAIAISKSL